MGAAAAAGPGPSASPPPFAGRAASVIGNVLFTLAAIGGVICMLAVLAAWIFRVTLVMFSTGSMSPTIPAGSVAVVRQIPAAQVRVGDVVTVTRPGRLPVTHRVRDIEAGPADTRILTLRGDANSADDSHPYPVQSVRRVMFSIPGLATVIVTLADPLVLGAITIAMAVLVLWAFWPRPPPTEKPGATTVAANGGPDARPQSAGRHRTELASAATIGGAVGAVLLAATGVLFTSAGRADAATDVRVIKGSVITLTTVGDASAMTNLQPGRPVRWQVGVSSDPPEPGRIDLSVSVSGPLAAGADGFLLSLASCQQRWTAGRCPAGVSVVLPRAPAAQYRDQVLPAGTMPAGEQRWLQVQVELTSGAFASGTIGSEAVTSARQASVRVQATGFGDRVSSGPGGNLPDTGVDGLRHWLVVGIGTLLLGALVLLAARRRAVGHERG